MTKKELNAIITSELSIFDIKKAKLGDDFSYDYEKDKVTYRINTIPTFEDIYFSKFLKERFDFDDKYPFVSSLLHEVGHAKNNDDIIDDVQAFCIGEKYKILEEINSTDDYDRIEKLNFRYFYLPDEIMATAWAVQYMKNHPKEIKRMAERIAKAIEEYLK